MWKISPANIRKLTSAKYLGAGTNALVCRRGTGDIPVALDGITHGQEYAGALALVDLAREDWEGRWPNLKGALVWSDLDGLAREGYGFVSVSGKSAQFAPRAPPVAGNAAASTRHHPARDG
jgi:predicted N-acetyltransferase YhbS